MDQGPPSDDGGTGDNESLGLDAGYAEKTIDAIAATRTPSRKAGKVIPFPPGGRDGLKQIMPSLAKAKRHIRNESMSDAEFDKRVVIAILVGYLALAASYAYHALS